MTALTARLPKSERRAVATAAAAALFLVSWGLVHRGFYADSPIVDTGLYQAYGDRMAARQVPYRDFAVEYPPGALPAFFIPSLLPPENYVRGFEWLMALLGVATVVVLAQVRLAAAFAVALSPLLVGSLVLSRFDLWPAALAAAALVALLRARDGLGWGLLGAAVAAKLWPLVLVPAAVAWSRRRGRLRAVWWGVAVLVAAFLPFAILAPRGVWDSLWVQASRPLQIESLGGALAMAVGAPHVITSHGSQNVAGFGWLAALSTVAQVAVLVGVWVAALRRPADAMRFAAAAVAAFIALGKVLSPQFLIWLVPLVPLVRGRRGVAAMLLLGCALVLTQVWFPFRYWDYVAGRGALPWVVLARDLVLVALVVVLALPARMRAREL